MEEVQLDLLSCLIEAPGCRGKWRTLREHPELLSDPLADAMDELIGRFERALQAGAATVWPELGLTSALREAVLARDLVTACRRHGIEAAFDQIVKDVEQATLALVAAYTWTEKLPILERSRLATCDLAEEFLGYMVGRAEEAGNARVVREFLVHRELVRRWRTSGASAVLEQFAAATDADVAEELTALVRAAAAAYAAYENRGDLPTLEQAADLARTLLTREDFARSLSPFQLAALELSGKIFLQQYTRDQSHHSLAHLVEIYDLGVAQIHRDRRSLVRLLMFSGEAHHEQFLQTQVIDDLHMAIIDVERAAVIAAEQGSTPAALHAQLARHLARRHEVLERREDLDRAIRCLEAVEKAGSFEKPENLADLGVYLFRRFRRDGATVDLDRAIQLTERAVGDPGRSAVPVPDESEHLVLLDRLLLLGTAFASRFQLHRRLEDVDNAVSTFRHAVQLCPPSHPHRRVLLERLAINLRERYRATADLKDVDAAIKTNREIEALRPDDFDRRRTALDELGGRLWDRFHHTGSLDDLDEALCIFERAVAITPAEHPLRASALNNLGVALRDRAQQTGRQEDLNRAVSLQRRAVACTPKESNERAAHAHNLGITLRTRAVRTQSRSDADRTIRILRCAVRLTPYESPDYPRHLVNLANALLFRYEFDRNPPHLDEAIDLLHSVRDHPSVGGLGDPHQLCAVAVGLRKRYERDGNPDDLNLAIHHYRSCCRQWETGWLHTASAPFVADSWGRWAQERGADDEAGEAFSFAVSALRRLFRSQVLRSYKEQRLGATVGIADRAAAAMARIGNFPAAVELVEAGKALLLTEALDLEPPELDRLRNDPDAHELFDRYQEVAHHVRSLRRAELRTNRPDQYRLGLRDAETRIEAVLEEIRAIRGFESVGRPLTAGDIARTADDRPLVYLLTTVDEGRALIVQGDGSITSVILPELTLDGVRKIAEVYSAGFNRGASDPRWHTALEETCRWLWGAAMGPIVDAAAGYNQMTLVPTGLLGFLPLHAAFEDRADGSGRRYVIDSLALSYTPNARSLQEARRLAASTSSDSVLVIDDPQPVRALPLLNSRYEVSAAIRGTREEERRVLRHEQATVEAVKAAMEEYCCLHFSCHGISDFRNPLDSGLFLAHDQRLSLRDVLEFRLTAARLVVLSACESNLPGISLVDEAIGLPAGLLQARVAGVIGSLWAVNELSTMELMVRFYEIWRAGHPISVALRTAQQLVRDTTVTEKRTYLMQKFEDFADPWSLYSDDDKPYEDLHYWAAFAHVGM